MKSIIESLTNLDWPGNVVVNIVGSPGSGKSIIINNLTALFLDEGKSVVFVTLDQTPQQIISRINGLTSIDHDDIIRLLTIVDGYSSSVGLRSEADFNFNSRNLSDFNITLYNVLKRKPEVVFIDPYTALFIHQPEDHLLREIQIAIAKLRAGAKRSFIAYEEGVHSQTFYNTINFLGDINLQLRQLELESGDSLREIQFHSSRGAHLDEGWRSFSIDAKGRTRQLSENLENPPTPYPRNEVNT